MKETIKRLSPTQHNEMGLFSLQEVALLTPISRKTIFDRKWGVSNSIWAWTLILPFVFIVIVANLPKTCESLSLGTSPKATANGTQLSTATSDHSIDIQTEKPSASMHLQSGRLTRFGMPKRSSRDSSESPIFYGESYSVGGNTGEDVSRYWSNGPCLCWNTTDGSATREVECKCSGQDMNRLTTTLLPDVHRLTIEHARNFTTLSNEDLSAYANSLVELTLNELPQFNEIKNRTFYGMVKLNAIAIHGAHSLTEIPDQVFKVFLPKLNIIRITHSSLEVAPNLSELYSSHAFNMIDLENNKISKLIPGSFKNLKTEQLSLEYNDLKEIGRRAFEGSTIARLSLKGNRQLTSLHPESFVGIDSLRKLDLSGTAITYLPTLGLKELESLRLEDVLTLSVIPSIYHFENLREAKLTWPYHCCAFEFPETHDPVAFQKYKEFILNAVTELCKNLHSSTTSTPTISAASETSSNVSPTQLSRKRRRREFSKLTQSDSLLPHAEFGKRSVNSYTLKNTEAHIISEDETYPSDDSSAGGFDHHDQIDPFDPYVFDPERSFGSLDPNDLEKASDFEKDVWTQFGHSSEGEFDDDIGVFHRSVTPSPTVVTLCGNVSVRKPPKVQCHPIPDAFNPCEDIMGSLWLRGAVWVVVALALVGNTVVLVVLLLAPGRMTVQRLLMANLSWADLCMGIYLLMVATEDLVSLGSYFNYAIDWQLGWGCQIAGFLTVFASELSVFTLAVITGERWYALTRAIHLTKRLTIVGAAQLMSLGWFLAILLAGLPLVGVSSYSKTSICLPMEAESVGAVVYLSFLLLFNGLAFLIVATAYLQMYRAVAGHGGGAAAPGASSADTAIAKKMALLVFTDFACWAPVAFFGLTAVGGYPLIGVTDSKILLVFFYPLNSTLNPYLYAIMTKQYRRDLLLLLSRHGMCTRRAARYKTGQSTNNTLQTMQTVLRLGSVTETKVAQHHNNHQPPHPSPNGDGPPKGPPPKTVGTVIQSQLDCSTKLEVKPIIPPTTNSSSVPLPKEEGLVGLVNDPSCMFDHPLLPPVSNIERIQEGGNDKKRNYSHSEDEDHLNGVVGRNIAETSFIRVPSVGGSSKGFLKGQKSPAESLLGHTEISEEYHDLDHDVSEITPFCRSHESAD